MPLVLTELAKSLSQQSNVKVNIIVEIDGFNFLFGTLNVGKSLTFDMPGKNFDEGLSFDSQVIDERSKALINLDKTSRSISSQLDIEKGIEAIRSFSVDLIDKDNFLTEIFTPGHTVPDLLGRKAKVFLNIVGSNHPVDSILIIEGIVGSYDFTSRQSVRVSIDHVSQLKRQDIFLEHQTELDGSLANNASSINVNDASGFVLPSSELKTYVRINDEIIEYTGISNNTLTGISTGRAQLQTVTPSAHDDDTEVSSLIRLQGNAVHLALKLMMSTGGFGLESTVTAFNQLTPDLFRQDSIVFDVADIETEFGLVIGDIVQISGSTNNDQTTTIKSFGKINELKSFITVNDTLNTSINQNATIKFKSQFDTLSQGGGLLSTQVDVPRHLFFLDLFSTNFPEMDFYLTESIKIDDFVSSQLYKPCNLYAIPGSRASVKMTIPPLTEANTKTLNKSNVVSPDKINITRSVNRYHFNTLVYKFDVDSLDVDKFLSGRIVLDNDSLTRIGVGKKVYKIEAKGFRRNSQTQNAININSRRFLDRYKNAAEYFELETFFSNVDIEVGDSVIVDGEGLNLYDSEKGTRDFGPRVFEVINKSVSIGSAKIKLKCLATDFGLDGRFGVISPASKIASGATTTNIPLKQSFGFTDNEYEKWEAHTGATVRVHSDDWTYDQTTKIVGFDSINENTMIVSPALSVAPSEDHIVDTSKYNDSEDNEQNLLRDMYVFVDPTLSITGVTSSTIVSVSVADAAKLFADSIIEVHNNDYTQAEEAKVLTVVGTTITFAKALSFTPTTSHKIQLCGFVSNQGKPYRII